MKDDNTHVFKIIFVCVILNILCLIPIFLIEEHHNKHGLGSSNIELSASTGSKLLEGKDGFADRAGDSWTLKMTKGPMNVGSKLKYTITKTNNSKDDGTVATQQGWIGDIIWYKNSFYNITDGIWYNYPEELIAAYNSTHPITNYSVPNYPSGYYIGQYYVPGMDGWELVFELRLEEEEKIPSELLVSIIANNGEAIGIEIIIGIIILCGVSIIVVYILKFIAKPKNKIPLPPWN